MRRFLAWGVIALMWACAGCGGGGASLEVLHARYQALLSTANSRNLTTVMSNYSLGYVQGCATWSDVRDGWWVIFNEEGFTVKFTDLRIDFTFKDENAGIGLLEGSFHVREVFFGEVTEYRWWFSMAFVREGGKWLFYGNQECPVGDPAGRFEALLGQASGSGR